MRLPHLCLIGCTLVPNAVTQDSPLTLTAGERDGRVYLGGAEPEAAWEGAEALVIPVETEIIYHPPLQVTVRALVDDERLYLRVEWPDEDADTACWQWSRTDDGWEMSPARDDGLQILWVNPGGSADRWDWWAHRTNAVGCAQDMAIPPGPEDAEASSDPGDMPWRANASPDHDAPAEVWAEAEVRGAPVPDPAGMTLRSEDHLFEGQTRPLGQIDPRTGEPWETGDTVPGVISGFPTGSQADVEAVGSRDDGRWILEIRRLLDTGDPDHDLVLAHGAAHSFTIHFEGTEPRIADIRGLLILP